MNRSVKMDFKFFTYYCFGVCWLTTSAKVQGLEIIAAKKQTKVL